jgi:hypothetical protein
MIPSPTIITGPWAAISRIAANFSSGCRRERASGMPIRAATVRAVSGASPVSITIRVIPASRRRRIIAGASGRTVSSNTSIPARCESTPTKAIVLPA